MIKVSQIPILPVVIYDEDAVHRYVRGVIMESKRVFTKEHSKRGRGRKYGSHIASAAGDFPAKHMGALLEGTQTKISNNEGVIGTNVHYSVYLANGTMKMAARKMYREALDIALNSSSHLLKNHVRYK
jgi:phage gpG-like protein